MTNDNTHNRAPLRPGFNLTLNNSVDHLLANLAHNRTTLQPFCPPPPPPPPPPPTPPHPNKPPTPFPPPPPLWSATQTRTTYGSLRGMPACGQAMGCGVCDTPELWRGATGLCARVCACAGAAESAYTYIHTLQPGSPLTLTHAARVKGSGVTRSLRARPPCIRMHSIYTYIYTCMHI